MISPSSRSEAEVTLIATGSEVHIAVEAQNKLQESGINTKVVSMPCIELFKTQTSAYKREILGENTLKIAIEAGTRGGWGDIIGENGIFIGIESFGASAPAEKLYEHFGITADAIASRAKEKLTCTV